MKAEHRQPAGHPTGQAAEIAQRRIENISLTRVLVAAENDVLRAGIATLMKRSSGLAVAESSTREPNLVHEVERWRPDVLLIDVMVAAQARACLGRRSPGVGPELAILALALDELPELDVLQDLSRNGVCGVVSAQEKIPALADAVSHAHHGEPWLSPAIGGAVMSALTKPVTPGSNRREPDGTRLSATESRVLSLVADGLTVGQIAARLNRSESTVKYHLSNMCARYQARNRAHLVYLSVRAGDLPMSD